MRQLEFMPAHAGIDSRLGMTLDQGDKMLTTVYQGSNCVQEKSVSAKMHDGGGMLGLHVHMYIKKTAWLTEIVKNPVLYSKQAGLRS